MSEKLLREALEKIANMDAPTFVQAFGRCVDIARTALAQPKADPFPDHKPAIFGGTKADQQGDSNSVGQADSPAVSATGEDGLISRANALLIGKAVSVVREAFFALEDSEELQDGRLLIDAANAKNLSAALDILNELPAQPGYCSGEANNLDYALTQMVIVAAESAADDRRDAERWRGLLAEAADEIESWGQYAGDYFKKKWDLVGTVKRFQDASQLGTNMSKLSHSNEEFMGKIDAQRAARDGVSTGVTKEMVDRFLSWKLPQTFSPDNYIAFTGRGKDTGGYEKTWPVGTNLFSADEAREMLEHAVAGDFHYQEMLLQNAEKEVEELRELGAKALRAFECVFESTMPYRDDGTSSIPDKAVDGAVLVMKELSEKLGVVKTK